MTLLQIILDLRALSHLEQKVVESILDSLAVFMNAFEAMGAENHIRLTAAGLDKFIFLTKNGILYKASARIL
jgi:hypothetical protein